MRGICNGSWGQPCLQLPLSQDHNLMILLIPDNKIINSLSQENQRLSLLFLFIYFHLLFQNPERKSCWNKLEIYIYHGQISGWITPGYSMMWCCHVEMFSFYWRKGRRNKNQHWFEILGTNWKHLLEYKIYACMRLNK